MPPGPIYVDTQHVDLVHDAQLDYYGCKLATCSSGEIIMYYLFMMYDGMLSNDQAVNANSRHYCFQQNQIQ